MMGKKYPKRTGSLRLRISEEERAIIWENADKAGLSLSDYVRKVGIAGKIEHRESLTDIEAVYQLKKIGANLNQIAHVLNAGGERPLPLIDDALLPLKKVLFKMLEDYDD